MSTHYSLPPPGIQVQYGEALAGYPPGFSNQSTMAPAIFSPNYLSLGETTDQDRNTRSLTTGHSPTTPAVSLPTPNGYPGHYRPQTNSSPHSSQRPAGLPISYIPQQSPARPPVSGTQGPSLYSPEGSPRPKDGHQMSSIQGLQARSPPGQIRHSPMGQYLHESPVERRQENPETHSRARMSRTSASESHHGEQYGKYAATAMDQTSGTTYRSEDTSLERRARVNSEVSKGHYEGKSSSRYGDYGFQYPREFTQLASGMPRQAEMSKNNHEQSLNGEPRPPSMNQQRNMLAESHAQPSRAPHWPVQERHAREQYSITTVSTSRKDHQQSLDSMSHGQSSKSRNIGRARSPVNGKSQPYSCYQNNYRAPASDEFPIVNLAKRASSEDVPLDLTVKKTRLSMSQPDSDDDVIVLRVQGPDPNSSAPWPHRRPLKAGLDAGQRGQHSWNFPQLNLNGKFAGSEHNPFDTTTRHLDTLSNKSTPASSSYSEVNSRRSYSGNYLQSKHWQQSPFQSELASPRDNRLENRHIEGGNRRQLTRSSPGPGSPPSHAVQRDRSVERSRPSSLTGRGLSGASSHHGDSSSIPDSSTGHESGFHPTLPTMSFRSTEKDGPFPPSVTSDSNLLLHMLKPEQLKNKTVERVLYPKSKDVMPSTTYYEKHQYLKQPSMVMKSRQDAKPHVSSAEARNYTDHQNDSHLHVSNTVPTVTPSPQRGAQMGVIRLEEGQAASLQRTRDPSGHCWPQWRNIKSSLSVAESPVRLSTLMEPVSVTRCRNDGLFGDQTPKSPPIPQNSQSDMQLEDKCPTNQQSPEQTTGNRKSKIPFRSKKEYILAHLQQEHPEFVNAGTPKPPTPIPKTISLGQDRDLRTAKTVVQENCNVSNNNSSNVMLIDLKSPIKSDMSKARDFTPATVAYLQNRVIAEVIEQSKTEKNVSKEDTWATMSNSEYFPRGAPLELGNVKRIPVANVQPIVKDKATAPEKKMCDSVMTKKENERNHIQEIEKRSPDSQPSAEASASPNSLSHQLEFVKFISRQEDDASKSTNDDIGSLKNQHYRTPTPATCPDTPSDISGDKDERSSVRKNLALHFSTPKGRHKLFCLDPDGSVSSPVDKTAPGGLPRKPEHTSSRNCLDLAAVAKPALVRLSTDDTNRTTLTASSASAADLQYKNLTKARGRRPKDKSRRKGPCADRKAVWENSNIEKTDSHPVHLTEKCTDQHQDTKRGKGPRRKSKYSKRRLEKRQTRSTRLRRALRSSRNCNSYNKNSAYEAELRKEEERKLQRKENKHAQIRKTLRNFDSAKDALPKNVTETGEQLSVDETSHETLNDIVPSPANLRQDISPPKSPFSKQLTIRRYRRRRKDYFDTDKRAKNKRVLKQRQRKQDGESVDSGFIPSEENTLLTSEFDSVDAGVRSIEPGHDIRTCDVHDAGTSADLTTAADARRLVVCKETGETTLHKAARLGYKDIALSFMSCENVDVNVRDNAGYTPLHESCASGNLQIASCLIQRGADVNAKAYDGTRPLHDAVVTSHLEVVRLLLSHGADPTIANYSGKTPQKLARSPQMVTFLQGYYADLNGERDVAIPWEFDQKWQDADEHSVEINVLADVPADDGEDGTPCTDGADEIVFEFTARQPLPAFNICTDKNKGPRNYHLVSDVASRLGMTVSDFTILNNDLTIVDVSVKTLLCLDTLSSARKMAVSLHPSQHSSTTVALVEIDVFLRQLLDITPESLTKYEPVKAIPFPESEAIDKKTNDGKVGVQRFSSNDNEIHTGMPSYKNSYSERFSALKQNKSRAEHDMLMPYVDDEARSNGSSEETLMGSSSTQLLMRNVTDKTPSRLGYLGDKKHSTGSGTAKVKPGHTSQTQSSDSSPLALLSELSHSSYNAPVGEMIHGIKSLNLGTGVKHGKINSHIGQYIVSFGLVVKADLSVFDYQTSMDKASDDCPIVQPARFVYTSSHGNMTINPPKIDGCKPTPTGMGDNEKCERTYKLLDSKNNNRPAKNPASMVKIGASENSVDNEQKYNKTVYAQRSEEYKITDIRGSGSRSSTEECTRAPRKHFLKCSTQNRRSTGSSPYMAASESYSQQRLSSKTDKVHSTITSDREAPSYSRNPVRRNEMKCPTQSSVGQHGSQQAPCRQTGRRSPIPRLEGRQESGDPALPVLEKLDMEETACPTTEETVFDDRQMPKLTLYA